MILSLISLGPATAGALLPTIVDNAFAQGLIPADEISIAFEPTTTAESLNGVLTWGISVLINESFLYQLMQTRKVGRTVAFSQALFRSGMLFIQTLAHHFQAVYVNFYSPVTTVFPSSEFWGINQSIRYGTSTPILAQTVGIVDSGKRTKEVS